MAILPTLAMSLTGAAALTSSALNSLSSAAGNTIRTATSLFQSAQNSIAKTVASNIVKAGATLSNINKTISPPPPGPLIPEYRVVEKPKDIVNSFNIDINKIIEGIKAAILGNLSSILSPLTPMVQSISNIPNSIISSLLSSASSLQSGANTLPAIQIPDIVKSIKDILRQRDDRNKYSITSKEDEANKDADNAFNLIPKSLVNILNDVKDAILGLPTAINKLGVDIIASIKELFKFNLDDFIEGINYVRTIDPSRVR